MNQSGPDVAPPEKVQQRSQLDVPLATDPSRAISAVADGASTARSQATASQAAAEVGTPQAVTATGGAKHYEVTPPAGLNHDTLWSIAERTLGDPLRYKEIYALNEDRIQADGSRLTDADLVRPGWRLLLPADAHGAGVRAASPAVATMTPDTGLEGTTGDAAAASHAHDRSIELDEKQFHVALALFHTKRGARTTQPDWFHDLLIARSSEFAEAQRSSGDFDNQTIWLMELGLADGDLGLAISEATRHGNWIRTERPSPDAIQAVPVHLDSTESHVDRLAAVGARRRLLDLAELRLAHSAAASGSSQSEIAHALGVSQPTIHRMLRRTKDSPEVLLRSPGEVIAEAVAGIHDRAEMLEELVRMHLEPGRSSADSESEGYIPGDWDQVVEAWERGWLSDDEYEQLARG